MELSYFVSHHASELCLKKLVEVDEDRFPLVNSARGGFFVVLRVLS